MRILFPLVFLSLLSLPALADTSQSWQRLDEQNESAFSLDAPKNWSVETGVARNANGSIPVLWTTAHSADHQSDIVMGDPSLPHYINPINTFRPARPVPGSAIVMPYQTGQQYAVSYVPKIIPSGATDVRLEEAKEEAEMTERAMEKLGPNPSSTISVGSARYSYMLNGERKVAGAYLATMNTPGALGAWSPINVWTYHTRAGNEGQMIQTIEHMRTSFKTNPQWMSAQMNNMNQQAAQWNNILQQQRQQGAAMLKTQADTSQAWLNASHQNAMNNIQAIGDRSRAQAAAQAQWHSDAMVNHYAQMAAKDNNNYHEVLMIQNKHLEWSPTLQRNVEVPN